MRGAHREGIEQHHALSFILLQKKCVRTRFNGHRDPVRGGRVPRESIGRGCFRAGPNARRVLACPLVRF